MRVRARVRVRVRARVCVHVCVCVCVYVCAFSVSVPFPHTFSLLNMFTMYTGSVTAAFALSRAINMGKLLDMEHVQNATLAGGVAIGINPHSHKNTHTHTHAHTLTHTHTHSLSYTLTHLHTHNLISSLAHTHTHARTYTHTRKPTRYTISYVNILLNPHLYNRFLDPCRRSQRKHAHVWHAHTFS